VAAPGWWPHYRAARATRFTGGQGIEAPVTVVWGDRDRIAVPRSRHTDQLPPHARVETWERCGHLVMWDQPDRLVSAALALG
jgi:pimeloyl-ACP methyl ester carboxylesterase